MTTESGSQTVAVEGELLPSEQTIKNLSPHGKAMMRALGGDPRSFAVSPAAARRWGVDQPESVFNLLEDPEFIDRTATLPSEFFAISESSLVAQVQGGVSRTDIRAKLAFWDEYERAAKEFRPMDLENMLEPTGAGKWAGYSRLLLANQQLHAWFMSPPIAYLVQMREAQTLSLRRLMEILELPITVGGKVNVKVAELILKAHTLIDLRVQGGIVQRIAQTSHHLHTNANPGDKVREVPQTAAELDQKIKSIEDRLKGMGAI